MEKTLFKSKEEFDSFIGVRILIGTVKRWSWAEEPKKYPCIAVWEIQYNEDGPDILEYELVYPEDFKL